MPMNPGELLRRLQYLLFRDRYTAELEEEMRVHRELRAERLQGTGLSPDAAAGAARRRFGNPTRHQERSRDVWGMRWLENAAEDLRFAVRRLRNRPGFAISTIAVAALGIGATTAVFSAVDAALIRPLPFHRSHELVMLNGVSVPSARALATYQAGRPHTLTLADVRAQTQLFSQSAAYASGGLNLEDPDRPRRVTVGVVTADFFAVLGVAPARGRAFDSDTPVPGARQPVILSDGLWRSWFGGADVIGRSVVMSGRTFEIVGIMAPGFRFPGQSDLWVQLTVPTTPAVFAPFRGYLPSTVIARLAPGVTAEVAAKQMLAVWRTAAGPAQPGQESDALQEVRKTGAAHPLQQNLVGGERRRAFLVLFGATLLLLLIASANVAGLLLSDGAARGREIALRESLGAERGRIIRQLLVESALLSMCGAILGLALVPVSLSVLSNMLPLETAATTPIHIDLRVLGFATLLALATGLVFGLWPAMGAARVDPAETLKSSGASSSGRHIGHARRLLIVGELALTVMLLVGAGLMTKSLDRLLAQNLGIDPQRVATLEFTFVDGLRRPAAGSKDARDFVRDILDRLAVDPAIIAAGAVNDLPLRGGAVGIGIGIDPIGTTKPEGVESPRYLIASPGYFRAMGIPLLHGRDFTADDDTIGTAAAIINATMAKAYWSEGTAIGRSFYFGGDTSVAYTVVGVVADVREDGLRQPVRPQLYFSMNERAPANVALVARSTLPPEQLLPRLNAAVRFVRPHQAVYNLRMMEDVIGAAAAPQRANTMLIAGFGTLALLLSAFGVYAVVSYAVARRTREFGIRAALGAQPTDIIGMIGTEMSRLVLIGLALGLVGAWAFSRVLASSLYDVAAHDPATFAVVPVILAVPAAIAILLPALRAVRVSPTEVMRAE